ncbi:hypothetical protein GIB67_023824, partial [Kingdonia uniflora]
VICDYFLTLLYLYVVLRSKVTYYETVIEECNTRGRRTWKRICVVRQLDLWV